MSEISEYNRDTEYWNEFYRRNPPSSMQETRFARFASRYMEKNRTLVDVGCGNGRDSFFFNRLGLNVIGIDASDSAVRELNRYSTKNLIFVCGNFITDRAIFRADTDYFYSRFTLHAIDEAGEWELLRNVFASLSDGGKFFIEVRGVHDEKFGRGEMVGRNAFLLDGHFRRFVVMNELLSRLIETGFSIKYAEEERGFAPFNGEDSEIIRVIAVKSLRS